MILKLLGAIALIICGLKIEYTLCKFLNIPEVFIISVIAFIIYLIGSWLLER